MKDSIGSRAFKFARAVQVFKNDADSKEISGMISNSSGVFQKITSSGNPSVISSLAMTILDTLGNSNRNKYKNGILILRPFHYN